MGYARVSSQSQKDDLERQVALIKNRGVEEVLTDVGSGLNEGRRNFRKILKMVTERKISHIVISYPDRLTRFGFQTLKNLFSAFGTEITVINENQYKSPQEEMVKDLITIISHFCGKLYGTRSHKNKQSKT